jgi:hypothetical protein
MSLNKSLCILIIFLNTISCGKKNNASIEYQNQSFDELIIHSSSTELNEAFQWAQEKALSYVQTNKSGPINAWENGPGSDTVNYIPSYWAGYPKRSAFYSRDFCHQLEGAHLLGLEEENFQMMKAFGTSADASKKWFPLWALNFDGSTYTVDYKSDSNFVREIPATFELVEKAYELFKWTGDLRYLENDQLWIFYSKAVTDFIQLHDQKIPNGIAEGTGKGIFDGAASYNEQRDKPLIEAGDALASQYKALSAFSKMAEIKRLPELASQFSIKADQLKDYFNNDWGIINTDLYNRGYLEDGTPVDGWGKENSWFMPMKGLTKKGSQRTLDYLNFIDERLESKEDIPENIEAISYIPETFFFHNQNEVGWKWMKHIINKLDQDHSYSSATGRNGDYPEVSYVLIRNVIVDLLGVIPNASKNEISTLSHLPQELEFLEVENIKIGNSILSVHHQGTHSSKIKYLSGNQTLNWKAEFTGNVKSLFVNGDEKKATYTIEDGFEKSFIVLNLKPGEEVEVTIKE